MPCVIGPRFEKMSEEEQAKVYKATWWADLIAASEWPALLKKDGFSPSARSRLKKKAAGWLIALGRVAAINPDLFAEVLQRATKEYKEQTETEHPFLGVQQVCTEYEERTGRRHPFLGLMEICSSVEADWESDHGADADSERRRGWLVTYGYLNDDEELEDE
jgi:hypothetical protein